LLLYYLLWTAETITSPSFRNLNSSLESWAYRRGCLRQLRELEKDGYLEADLEEKSNRRLVRLTEQGRIKALGGYDPPAIWNRPWDGKWRFAIFDVPEKDAKLRRRFRRVLRHEKFGILQKSVWITPSPLPDVRSRLRKDPVFASRILFLEGHPCGGESDADLVRASWNWSAITKSYKNHSEHLDHLPGSKAASETNALRDWMELEHQLWERCMELDPLLPKALHLSNYPGPKAWRRRLAALKKAGRRLRQLTGSG